MIYGYEAVESFHQGALSQGDKSRVMDIMELQGNTIIASHYADRKLWIIADAVGGDAAQG